ncbi:heme-degrading domain-containing protein [Anaerostipes sp.]|uniref:heme-degrading domain-containing protein n=1 Tax=Anaerostipes sp. TaxID=1872530 RepID=UPI0025BE6F18|nr:heme-degrading domain-containing protein [Anaerostipes sp.]MBS7007813.1 heme-degrading domain-containing protein [Anaerostipes sp.]
MKIEDQINKLEQDRKEVTQQCFSYEKAFKLGMAMYEKALKEKLPIVISITMNRHQIFYAGLDGSTCDNDSWVKRKENTVYYFEKSSYEMSLYMQLKQDTLDNRYGLPKSEYAAAGGCVPIVVEGAGFVGTVGISGLKQNEDHDFVMAALKDAKHLS